MGAEREGAVGAFGVQPPFFEGLFAANSCLKDFFW